MLHLFHPTPHTSSPLLPADSDERNGAFDCERSSLDTPTYIAYDEDDEDGDFDEDEEDDDFDDGFYDDDDEDDLDDDFDEDDDEFGADDDD